MEMQAKVVKHSEQVLDMLFDLAVKEEIKLDHALNSGDTKDLESLEHYSVLTYCVLLDMLNSPNEKEQKLAKIFLTRRRMLLVRNLPKIKDMYIP